MSMVRNSLKMQMRLKHVLQLAVNDRPYEETLMAFSHALELSSKIDYINGCLVERMVYIYMAYINFRFI